MQRSFDGKVFTTLIDILPGQYTYTTPGMLTWTDFGLPDGTRVWYRLRAFHATDLAANSAYTPKEAGTTMLPAPEITGAEAVSATEIRVAWDDNSDNEATFELEVTGGGQTRTITNIRPNATSYVVDDLFEFTPYTFTVTAVNSRTRSSPSAPSETVRPWAGTYTVYDDNFQNGPPGAGSRAAVRSSSTGMHTRRHPTRESPAIRRWCWVCSTTRPRR
jgi:hypothetical protein